MHEEDVSLYNTRQGNLKSHMDLAVVIHNKEWATTWASVVRIVISWSWHGFLLSTISHTQFILLFFSFTIAQDVDWGYLLWYCWPTSYIPLKTKQYLCILTICFSFVSVHYSVCVALRNVTIWSTLCGTNGLLLSEWFPEDELLGSQSQIHNCVSWEDSTLVSKAWICYPAH